MTCRIEVEKERIKVYYEQLQERVATLTPEQEEEIQEELSNIKIKKLSDYGEWFKRLEEELIKQGA